MGHCDREVAPGGAAPPPPRLGRNVFALSAVSFFTDVSSEMIYPLIPVFLTTVLGASASAVGMVEGAAESTAALLKLASGWLSDRVKKRKPLVVVGYAVASIARPLIGLAQSVAQVAAIRVTDRIGKGIRTAPRDALIADSVDARVRGRAFGFHRAADHAGAVVGPLIAFAVLRWEGVPLRTVFLFAAVPAVIAMIVLVVAVRETPRPSAAVEPLRLERGLGGRFWAFLGVVLLFTLGNSTDAFLLLRAAELGVPVALAPLLWAMLHVVKSISSTPGGALSDRIGRKPLIVAGWFVYAAVYLAVRPRDERLAGVGALRRVRHLLRTHRGSGEGARRRPRARRAPRRRLRMVQPRARTRRALPASILFGVIWDRAGAPVAFTFGAAMAALASLALVFVAPTSSQQQREPGRS